MRSYSKRVSTEDFVTTYMQAYKAGYNKEWVASQLGMQPISIATRATFLRKKGIKLPLLHNRRYTGLYSAERVRELNELIRRSK